MSDFFRHRLPRRLRRVPAAIGLLAVALQLMLPLLHDSHRVAVGTFGGEVAVLQAAGLEATSDHHAADCAQCRLGSQLKSLAAVATFEALPIRRDESSLDAALATGSFRSHGDSGAPRAPPLSV